MIGKATLFTSIRPAQLGKLFSLRPDGTLDKQVAGNMSEGTHGTVEFETVAGLAAILKSVGTNQALSSSVSVGADSGRVVTEKALPASPGAVARSKRFFTLRAGPGFLCLDHDPEKGKPVLDAITLYALLCELIPAAAQAGVVSYPSGSSMIYEGSKQHRGLAGMHLYVPIQDASDTERMGATLSKRSWLAGRGRFEVSASGALLARTTWDEAVHQKARLLFTGGAVGIAPIEQRRAEPVILSDGDFLDTRTACPDLTADEEARYIALVESAKAKARPAADAARQSWIEAKTKAELGKALEAGEDLTEARARISRTLDAALGGSLLGSFTLVVVDEQGKESTVTVDQVLADRDRYHLARALDPLNNHHRDRSPDAILYLRQAQPVAYSLDGGGVLWRLLRQPARLAVVQGEKARLAEQIADELATEADLFVVAGQVVQMQGGNVGQLSRPLLHYRVGCRVALYRQGKDKQGQAKPRRA